MQNRLEKRFKPEMFQTEIEGKPVRLTDLSHEDLLQVACEAQLVVQQLEDALEGVSRKTTALLSDYHAGRVRDTEPPSD